MAILGGILLGLQRSFIPSPTLSVLDPDKKARPIEYYLWNIGWPVLPDFLVILALFFTALYFSSFGRLMIGIGGLTLLFIHRRQKRFHRLVAFLSRQSRPTFRPFARPNRFYKAFIDEFCSPTLYMDSLVVESFIFFAFYNERQFTFFPLFLLLFYFATLSFSRLLYAIIRERYSPFLAAYRQRLIKKASKEQEEETDATNETDATVTDTKTEKVKEPSDPFFENRFLRILDRVFDVSLIIMSLFLLFFGCWYWMFG